MPKPAPKTAPTAPSTFDQAVVALANNLTAPNPYGTAPATESTTAAKVRLGLASRFELAREKAENAANRATGIVGRFGRVPATVKGFAHLASKSPTDQAFKFNDLVEASNSAFIAHNPDMKQTVASAKIYAQAMAQFAQLLGLLEYQPTTKTYRFTVQFRSMLQVK